MSQLIRVAVVPAAPLLVTGIGGDHADLAELRDEVAATCRWLVETPPAEVVVLAATTGPGEWDADTQWDFHGFGGDKPAGGQRVEAALPWPLGIGAWLLDQAGWNGGRRYLGRRAPELLPLTAGSAWLLVGDGAVGPSETAPAQDVQVALAGELRAALTDGDAAALDQVALRGLAAAEAAGIPGRLRGDGWTGWSSLARSLRPGQPRGHRLTAADRIDGVDYYVAQWEVSVGAGDGHEADPR